MAANRPLHDDTGPFASLVHELVPGGPGPQEHDFHMRDRDVTLIVETTNRAVRLLHLQNVRPDTVAAARAVVDDFLNDLEPNDDPKRANHTVFENFDKVRQELRRYVRAARVEMEDLDDELKMVDDAFPKKEAHTAPENLDNPVAAVQAACEVFLEKLKLIDDTDEPAKKQANVMVATNDKTHREIYEYMETQAEKRGLDFEWCDGCYPREALRMSGSRIRYDVHLGQNGSWGTNYGTR